MLGFLFYEHIRDELKATNVPQIPERRLRFVAPLPQQAFQQLLSSGCIQEIFGQDFIFQKNFLDTSLHLEEYHFETPRRIRIVLQCGNSRRGKDVLLTEQRASMDQGTLSQRQTEILHKILQQHCEKNPHHLWLSGDEISKRCVRSRSTRPDRIPVPYESSYWSILKKSGVLKILQQRYCPNVAIEDIEISIPVRYLAAKSLSMLLILTAHGEEYSTSISASGELQYGGSLGTSQLDAVTKVFDALLPLPISPKPYLASDSQQKTTFLYP